MKMKTMSMKNNIKKWLCILILPLIAACGDGSSVGVITAVNALALDSTNDRVFLSQEGQEMFVLEASTLDDIGDDQPTISEDNDEVTQLLLPEVVTHMVAYTSGSTTRLFIMGAFADSSDNLVFNRVRVLDFDGTTFTEASFSPIEITDGDDATTETDNSFADLLVDQSGSAVFITDASAAKLYVFDANDGTIVTGPITIAGVPQGMALDNGRLYVCNASTVAAEQVITVIKSDDFTTTTIDVDLPCSTIAVQTNDSGTAMMFKRSGDPEVGIYLVDTSTYAAATVIAAAEEGYTSGSLSSGAGISSVIEDIVMARDSSGIVYGYLSELDGNIQKVTLELDLSSYSHDTLSTTAEYLNEALPLVDSSFNASNVLIASETGSVVSVEIASDEIDAKN